MAGVEFELLGIRYLGKKNSNLIPRFVVRCQKNNATDVAACRRVAYPFPSEGSCKHLGYTELLVVHVRDSLASTTR